MRTEEETVHAAILRKQWAVANEASRRRHVKITDGTLAAHTVKAPPALAVVMATEKSTEEARRLEAEAAMALKNQPGLLSDEGVFIGRYAPKDGDGKSLGKIFNVYAAPEDLTDAAGEKALLTYPYTVKRIAELKGWHGFNGTRYADDTEFYQALKDGTYHGGWIIPPNDLLGGFDNQGKPIQSDTIPLNDTLYASKDKGALKDSFLKAPLIKTESTFAMWYWSSTKDHDDSSKVWNVHFIGGCGVPNPQDDYQLSCRPVRLVPASA